MIRLFSKLFGRKDPKLKAETRKWRLCACRYGGRSYVVRLFNETGEIVLGSRLFSSARKAKQAQHKMRKAFSEAETIISDIVLT